MTAGMAVMLKSCHEGRAELVAFCRNKTTEASESAVAHLIWWFVCQCCCSRLTCSFTQLWRWDHALGVGVRHCGIHTCQRRLQRALATTNCIAYGT